MNQVIITGNLGKDAHIHTTDRGEMAYLSVAESDKWKDKQGNWQEKTRWHNVAVFADYLVRRCKEQAKKGLVAHVVGKLEYKTPEDGQKRGEAYITARDVTFLEIPKKETSESFEEGDGMGDDFP